MIDPKIRSTHKMKKTPFGRSFELAKMAAQIGLREVASGDIKSRIEQAKIIAEGLSQLKGAAMKAGQLLSIEVGDYFPKEAQEILSVLQNAATPVAFDEVRHMLELELGRVLFSELEGLNPQASASASIGQVHRARFRGRDVALKVQYRGVADSIESDLSILKKIATAYCKLSGREMDLSELFKEFQVVLSQEVDYNREAEFQSRYHQLISSLKPSSEYRYVVPQVVSELSTERVLATEWQEGITLKNWISQSRDKSKRELIAHAFLNLYCHEFFDWRLVQTDPNYANFLVREEGGVMTIVLLDFGATREYDSQFVIEYKKLLQIAGERDQKKLADEAIRFGLIDSRESASGFEAFYELMQVAIQPFFGNDGKTFERGSTFQFADENYARRSREVVRELTRQLKYSPPPYKLIFLHRKLGGLFSILKNLDIELDVSSYWRRMLSEISQKNSAATTQTNSGAL
jgi:aarF domain-containing kinase